jgi:hypothetical protein
VASGKAYEVYNLAGKRIGTVDLLGTTAAESLKAAGFKQGVYMLKQKQGNKKFMATVAK